MPIHYDIETDALYLEGFEVGFKQGLQKAKYETIARMLRSGEVTQEMIALVLQTSHHFRPAINDFQRE